MKKIEFILVAAAVVLTVTMAGCGNGDKENPSPDNQTETVPDGWTPIRTADDLYAVRNNLSGSYILMNDISLVNYSASLGWDPIGKDTSSPFTGKLNGNGHKITDLAISLPLGAIGLFGWIDGGSASNVGV